MAELLAIASDANSYVRDNDAPDVLLPIASKLPHMGRGAFLIWGVPSS